MVSLIRTFLKKQFSLGGTPSNIKPEASPILIPTKQVQSPVIHGTASVINGKVIVTDPNQYGSFATLSIPTDPRLEVLINGSKATGRVVVSASHTIEIHLRETEPSVTYDIAVSADRLSVTVRATVAPGSKLKLTDTEPIRHMLLTVEETPIYPEPVAFKEILDLLKEHDFKAKLDFEALTRLRSTTITREEVILRGTPPRPGKPARYKKLSVPIEIDPRLRRMRLSTVSTGQTVTIIEPEVPGLPGQDVYGRVIEAGTKSTKPTLGQGIVEVNGRIVAARDGRLVFMKNRIDVVPEYVIDHDLTARDGRVVFDGNVVVMGSVLHGAYIKAMGSVTVYGSVIQSTILGEQGVQVANVITGSQVLAGHRQILYHDLSHLVTNLILRLEKFLDEYRVMVEQAMKRFDAYSVIPKIPILLFDHRHPELQQDLNSFIEDFSSDILDTDSTYRTLYKLIRAKWQGRERTSIRKSDIQSLIHSMKAYLHEIQPTLANMSLITASGVTSSTLHATGNILIKGMGSFTSTLESGNTISVAGFVRGGFLVAKKAVYVGELGTQDGVECSVRVTNPTGVVRIRTRYPNTLVEINGERNRCYNTERNVRFRGGTHFAESIVG